MSNLHLPLIITFANQKGGVGKTTLCVCFADYLSSRGLRVKVIDCDKQQSISKCRARDVKKYGSDSEAYLVEGYPKMDDVQMRKLISETYSSKDIDITLVDCPGNMYEPFMIPLIANSDLLIVPFHYDDVTIASTSEFILFVERINNAVKRCNPFKLFLIPNLTDRRVGTADEMKKWEMVEAGYLKHGIVTPNIPKRAKMERLSTIADMKLQVSFAEPVFNIIHQYIFGSML